MPIERQKLNRLRACFFRISPFSVGFCRVSDMEFPPQSLGAVPADAANRALSTPSCGTPVIGVTQASSGGFHWLVRCREALFCLFRVHIEQGATGRCPGVVLPLKHGAGVANVSHCGYVFHLTAFDGFKSQVDGNQQIWLIRRAITEQDLSGQPVTAEPPQTAWKPGGRCPFEILKLKRFMMAFELP